MFNSGADIDEALVEIAAEVADIDPAKTWLLGVLASEADRDATIRELKFGAGPGPVSPSDEYFALDFGRG